MSTYGDVRSGTILTVVEEDDHSIGIHRLANEELVVLEVADDLLGVGGGTLLESGDILVAAAVALHGLLDLLHVGYFARQYAIREFLQTCLE